MRAGGHGSGGVCMPTVRNQKARGTRRRATAVNKQAPLKRADREFTDRTLAQREALDEGRRPMRRDEGAVLTLTTALSRSCLDAIATTRTRSR